MLMFPFEAESVAFVVCNHFGIDTSDYSFYYVTSWSSGKDTKELKASLQRIKDAASSFIEKIEKKFYKTEEMEITEDVEKTETETIKKERDIDMADNKEFEEVGTIRNDGLIELYTSKGYEFNGIEKLSDKARENLEKNLHKYEVLGYSGVAVHYLAIAETRYYPVGKAIISPEMSINRIKNNVSRAAGVVDIRILRESEYNIQ